VKRKTLTQSVSQFHWVYHVLFITRLLTRKISCATKIVLIWEG